MFHFFLDIVVKLNKFLTNEKFHGT